MEPMAVMEYWSPMGTPMAHSLPQQPASGRHQALKRCIRPLLGRFLRLDRDAHALADHFIGQQIHLAARVGRQCIITEFLRDRLREPVRHRILPVDHKDPLNGRPESADPFQQAVHIRMAADAVKAFDPGVHFDILTEELDILLPFHQPASQCPDRLITDKEDRTFGPPQIMLQMVADPPRVAHSGSGNDHFRFLNKIDHL